MDSDKGPDGPPDLPVDPDVDTTELLLGRPSARAVLREALRERRDVLAGVAAAATGILVTRAVVERPARDRGGSR